MILIYCDIGCESVFDSKQYILDFFEILPRSGTGESWNPNLIGCSMTAGNTGEATMEEGGRGEGFPVDPEVVQVFKEIKFRRT